MYTTIDNVREFSGFDDASKISGGVIRNKISMADAKLDGALAYRYSLPLNYHRQNKLTFSGEGTDTGTLTVTINGTDYAITITSGMTPSEAADAFRIAAVDSDDFITEGFITDDTSGDAVVTIISQTDSSSLATASAEVNITSAGGTVQGITGTAGTREDRHNPMVEQLSTEISTALLFMDNYGIEAEDTPKDGVARMERIDKMLLQLQGNDPNGITINLIDEVTKLEFTESTKGLPVFHPTNTTSSEDYDGDYPTQPNIKINDKF